MTKLSVVKRTRLAEIEAEMEGCLKVMELKGRRFADLMLSVRDRQLYTEYGTLEEYAERRWGLTVRRIRQLISFAETTKTLESGLDQNRNHGSGNIPDESVVPTHERQTRPLSGLEPEQQVEVWEEAVEDASGEQPTASQVQAAVDRVAANGDGRVREIGDEQEEAVLQDARGVVVPPRAAAAFDGVEPLTKAYRAFDQILKIIKDLCKTNAHWLDAAAFELRVKELRGMVKNNIPTHVCPFCNGKPAKSEACKQCRGFGWMPKTVFNAATAKGERMP